MSYLLFLLFCTFAINLALAVFVFVKNPKQSKNVVFALFGIGTAGWNLSLYLTLSGFEPQIIWARLPFSFGALMAAALLWFVHDFPNRTKHFKFWSRLSVVSGLIFFFLPITPWMLRSVDASQGYITGDLNAYLYPFWVLFFLISITYSLIRAWIILRKESGLKKNQALALVMGLTTFWVPVLITNTVLPIFGIFEWNSLGPVFTIFFIAFVAHAILRYRFLEIRWVVKRTLDVVFLWGVAFWIIYGFNISFLKTTEITVVMLLSSLAIAFVYIPISQFILTLTAQIAARGTYNLAKAQEQISLLSRSVDDLGALQREVANVFRDFLGYRRVAIVTFSLEQDKSIVAAYQRGFPADIERTHSAILPVMVKLKRNTTERAEIEWLLNNEQITKDKPVYERFLSLLEKNNVEAVIPFVIGSTQVALLLVGDKRDAKLLTKRDLFLVRSIQGSLAPALANAARFERMQVLYKELQEADKIKSEFIEVVSHQFRTPLTAILWDAELSIDQNPKPAAVRESLTDIKQRANFIRTVLLQMFDLLELQNKKMRFQSEPIALDTFTQELIDKNAKLCKEKGISFEMDLNSASAKADPSHLSSVFERILENACSYSHSKGKVTITTGADKKSGEAFIKIEDQGIGMSGAMVKNIFKKFYRGTDAKKEKPDGTGLSLYLANEVTRLMKGSIFVESKEGKGSTFTIRLPLS